MSLIEVYINRSHSYGAINPFPAPGGKYEVAVANRAFLRPASSETSGVRQLAFLKDPAGTRIPKG